MVKGKTSSGFEFTVNEKILTSWQFLTLFKKMKAGSDEEQTIASVDFVELVLGKQEPALEEHLRDEDGIVSSVAIISEAAEILDIVQKANADVKN